MSIKHKVAERIEEATQEYIRELERLQVCPVISDNDVVYWVEMIELEQEKKNEMYDNAFHELVKAAGDLQKGE